LKKKVLIELINKLKIMKSNKYNIIEIPSRILEIIFTYIDAKTLILILEKTCKKFKNFLFNIYDIEFSSQRRSNVLNNISNKISNIERETYNSTIFNNYILQLVNNNQYIYLFLVNLLKTNIFYIGGSFALIMTHYLKNKYINIDDYTDRDIDIFSIGDISLEIIQKTLQNILNKYLNITNIKSYCLIKKYLINIEFEDKNLKKIQIILHVKKTISEHMEFIDLPITQFLLGNNILYKTKLAQYALDTKIIIIDNISNRQTYNRIQKYEIRGYITIKTIYYGLSIYNNQRIISIFETKKDVLIEYFIDCTLLDIILLISEYHKIINNNNDNIFDVTKNYYYKNNNLNNTRVRKILPIIYKDKRYNFYNFCNKYKNLYINFEYDYLTTDFKKVIKGRTISVFKKKGYSQYLYNDNEYGKYHSYKGYRYEYIHKQNSTKNFPYFNILSSYDFSIIRKILFFKIYCSYFLNNNLCKLGIDDIYYNIHDNIIEKKINIPNWNPIVIPKTILNIDEEGFTMINKKNKLKLI